MVKNKIARFKKFKEKIPRKNLKIIKMSVNGHGISINKDDGKEIHILGAIAGDIVDANIYRELRGFYFAELTCVRHESIKRTAPKDALSFYSTSPWQIMKEAEELAVKKEFISRDFAKYADIEINSEIVFAANSDGYNYRNKAEYGFWYDKYAKKYLFSCFRRGSGKNKVPVICSSINYPIIDKIGQKFLEFLNTQDISPRILKNCIFRYSHSQKKVIIHLIVSADNLSETGIKPDDLEKFAENAKNLQGLVITNPAKLELCAWGELELTEELLGQKFSYRYDHFFQVNIAAFENVLEDVEEELTKLMKQGRQKWRKLLDLFAGVGVFGIFLNKFAETVQAVEICAGSKEFAEKNAIEAEVKSYSFRETSAEDSTKTLKKADLLFVDPPRTGIDKKTINAILRNLPKTIVYLSCNTRTQAKNFNELKKEYKIIFNRGYNFFPKTPHIEHLLILKKK